MITSTEKEPQKKAGIVALVGRSNVGKSTLLNALVGTKIAITTPKPQTTRDLIQGVLHDPRGQIVFVDTPGIFARVPDKLTAKLNEKAKDSVKGIDVLVYVVDPTRHVGAEEDAVHRIVRDARMPKILALNKADQNRPYIDEYLAWKDEFDAVLEVSAQQNTKLQDLIDAIMERLPEGEPLYPPDQITNVEHRFWLGEIIREKVFLAMHEEIPYATSVLIEEISRRENGIVYIKATVQTTSQRHKRMIIGAGARTIRRIGSASRKELEAVTGDKIYLDLDVAVEERWQERFE